MALLATIRIVCVIGVALAFNQQLFAQVVDTTTGPVVQTQPENGAAIAGTFGQPELIPSEIFGPLPRVRVSISVVDGYDDNVNTSLSGGSSTGRSSSGSLYTNGNATLSYAFGTPRTLLRLNIGGGVSYYYAQATDRINAHFGLSLTHRQTQRLTLSISVFASYQTEPDLSTNLSASRQLGNYLQSLDTVSVTYSWMPRFSTVTNYTLSLVNYYSSAGSLQNRMEHTFGQVFRYLVWPTTAGIAEYRYKIINYENDAPLDSTTNIFLAGLDHTFTPHMNATFRGGVELRSSQSSGSQLGPFFEGTLNYAFSRTGSVRWTNSYSIEEGNTPGASSSPAFRTGLDLRYRFTPRVSGSLALNYIQHSGGGSGGSSSSTGNTVDIAPTLRYAITHRLGVNVGYHYTAVDSGSMSGSYSRNKYFAGLNYHF